MTNDHDGRPWADIQRDFEARPPVPIDDICRRYNITKSMLDYRVRKYGWKRRKSHSMTKYALSRPLERLKHLVERKIASLETAMNAGTDNEAPDSLAIDRMSALVRLVERISTLEQKEKAAERAATPPRLVDNARRLELARRLDALRRQLESEGNLPRAEGA